MSSRGCNLLVCLLLFGVGWPRPLRAQDPAPSFRARSDVVLVDLIVTDQSGNFVADLNPEEIEVFEDGKRQELPILSTRTYGSFSRQEKPSPQFPIQRAPITQFLGGIYRH